MYWLPLLLLLLVLPPRPPQLLYNFCRGLSNLYCCYCYYWCYCDYCCSCWLSTAAVPSATDAPSTNCHCCYDWKFSFFCYSAYIHSFIHSFSLSPPPPSPLFLLLLPAASTTTIICRIETLRAQKYNSPHLRTQSWPKKKKNHKKKTNKKRLMPRVGRNNIATHALPTARNFSFVPNFDLPGPFTFLFFPNPLHIYIYLYCRNQSSRPSRPWKIPKMGKNYSKMFPIQDMLGLCYTLSLWYFKNRYVNRVFIPRSVVRNNPPRKAVCRKFWNCMPTCYFTLILSKGLYIKSYKNKIKTTNWQKSSQMFGITV